MTPLLAMIPAFQFWFGASNFSAILFVAYGTSIPFILGTINAVANVPKRYVESARTLGASRWAVYRMVVLPAILPEMFSTIVVALGLAWSAVIGAEYIGVQSGLGRVVIWSDYFSNTGRMVVVTFLIVAYAGLSFAIANAVRRRALDWMRTGDG
jgi:sulfonate transport system permease protein